MKIREATINDWQAIAGFQVAMAHETENIDLDPPTVEKGVKAVFDDPAKGIYFVAEHKNLIIGSLMITFEWSDWRNGNVWWIQSVYVVPEFRRNGVFKKMYTHLKELVSGDTRLRGLRLYADKTNKIAHKTYLNLGMNSEHYATFEWMK
jgi:GNAT superfamily N-acetyltransferase